MGKAPYKGECKSFLLPKSHLTLTAYYNLRVQWEDTGINRDNRTLNGTQIGTEVLTHFLNKSLKYNKKCSICTLELHMMSTNGTQELDHFILKLEIGTADMCPLETLQVDLLEPVDKQIAVKIRDGTATTIGLQVRLLTDKEVHAYEIKSDSMGFSLIDRIHRPCIRIYVDLRDIITCPQVEITERVIQSVTDCHLKTTLWLLFNNNTDFREHDIAVIFMCVDEYFNLPYGAGIAVHHGDPKLLAAIQVMAMFLLYSVRYGQYESDK